MRRLMMGLAVALITLATGAIHSEAQQIANGKVTTAAPTYVNNSANALSLDTAGYLRVTCDASCTGGGGGTSNVNIAEVGGTTVTSPLPVLAGQDGAWTVSVSGTVANNITEIAGVNVGSTVPGALDITCVSGCVAGSGVSQGTATTSPPTYVNGTNNPLSLDLAGNLRTSLLTALPAGSNSIGTVNVGNFPATQPVSGTVTANQGGTWNVGVTGTVDVSGSTVSVTNFPATQPVSGTVTANQGGSWTVGVNNFPATQPVSGTVTADAQPITAPGTTNYSLIAANSTNSTLVVSGVHAVQSVLLANNSANIAYLKLYDTGSAPTCGSGTPVARYMIPGASSGGAGSNISIALGAAFSSGIGFCLTGGIADADTTAVAASAYLINITYR